MSRLGRLLVLALLCAALSMAAPPGTAFGQSPAVSQLTVVSGEKEYRFWVEIADTPEDRERGLMFRYELAADAGMLFLFDETAEVAFWMRNTYIPLDLLFIAEDGSIVNIAERVVPRSLTLLPSAGPVRSVLEVRGGTVARLGIRPGDQILHRRLEKTE